MRRNAWLGFGAGAALLSILFGCGGAGGTEAIGGSGGSGGSGGGGALQEHGTAKVTVNAETGVVTVTPLGIPALGANQPKSLYTGSAVSVSSSSVSTDDSEVTIKKLKLSIKNNTSDTVDSARLIIDKISAAPGSVDLRAFTNVATVVGPGSGSGDGPGPSVTITSPNGIARDTDGSVYISGFGDGTMRRLKDGYVSRIATGLTAPGGVDVVAGSGFVYAVEQSGHNLVRVPTAGGAKYVLAGNGTPGNVDGSGSAARFNAPRDMAIHGSTAYIADFTNSRIRKVTNLTGASGVVTTLNVAPVIVNPAGIGTISLAGVDWLAVVSTTTHKLFLVNSASGQSFQIAGTGVPGFTEGAGNIAKFSSPSDVVSVGNTLYVCELNNKRIRQVTLAEGADPKNAANWMVEVVAGDGVSGAEDGPGLVAHFATPRHMTVDGSGALLVTDINNNRVRKMTPTSGIFPVTGSGDGINGVVSAVGVDGYLPDPSQSSNRKPYFQLGSMDATGSPSATVEQEINFHVSPGVRSFSFIVSVSGEASSTPAALDAVANASLPLLGSPNVNVRIIAGMRSSLGWTDGIATVARFGNEPYCATSDIGDFVADFSNSTVRFIDLNGTVKTIAGIKGMTGGTAAGGSGATCSFVRLAGIWANEAGTELFVAEYFESAILRLSRPSFAPVDDPNSWTVAVIAGAPGLPGNAVGSGATARFDSPLGITADPEGRTVFVSDFNNHTIKKLEFQGANKDNPAQWNVTFFAGSDTIVPGDADGIGTAARFRGPAGLDLSLSGELFVAEAVGHRVRRISPSRAVTLLAGSPTAISGQVDGFGSAAFFNNPLSVTVDNAGFCYVGSTTALRRISLATGEARTVAGISSTAIGAEGPGNVATFENIRSLSYNPRRGLIFGDVGGRVGLVERIVRNGAP